MIYDHLQATLILSKQSCVPGGTVPGNLLCPQTISVLGIKGLCKFIRYVTNPLLSDRHKSFEDI
jgi:hypothetical protein